jgi:hypothetical protein
LPRETTGSAAQEQERQGGQPWQDRQQHHEAGRHTQCARIGSELPEHGDVGAARDARLRDQQPGRHRDDETRNLRHEAVADGEQRVGVDGLAEADAHLRHADEQPADQIDRGDQ